MEFNATFLATIISFIVFVLLMNKILYAPILNIMEQRKAFVDGNYKTVEKNEAKIKKLVQKKEEKLKKLIVGNKLGVEMVKKSLSTEFTQNMDGVEDFLKKSICGYSEFGR